MVTERSREAAGALSIAILPAKGEQLQTLLREFLMHNASQDVVVFMFHGRIMVFKRTCFLLLDLNKKDKSI